MDPIGRALNPEEEAILTVLAQDGRDTHDCTVAGVAMALERDPVDVGGALARLQEDGLVTKDVDSDGDECWSAVPQHD